MNKMINTIKCSKCHSENIKKNGSRKTQNRGIIQRYKCCDCGFRFIENDGFYRMRNAPQKITLCLDLFYKGVSTRKVQDHLRAFYPHNSSHVSIYEWVIKYSNIIYNFTNKIPLKTGNELMVDEMEYSTKGKQSWFVDCMDTRTRYMVASDFMYGRTMPRLIKVLRNARKKTANQISVVTTDGLMAYPQALHKSFRLNKLNGKSAIVHNVVKANERGFNHKIERLHNSIRERTKTFRNFHGSIDSASTIMRGMEVYYNFIRVHQAIRCRPYELATDLKLDTDNKWLELIMLSK